MNCFKSGALSATQKALLSVLLLAFSTTGFAASAKSSDNDDEDTTAYVDSIHKWGAWELDIEPAAGGVQPATGQPVLARGSRVYLRTNSISALAPPPPKVMPPTTFAPNGSITGQKFTPPPSPNINPAGPSTPLPTGNGSLF